jgi:hypothetical protein
LALTLLGVMLSAGLKLGPGIVGDRWAQDRRERDSTLGVRKACLSENDEEV